MLRSSKKCNQNQHYLAWGFESQTNIAVVSQGLLTLVTFPVEENSGLLLESFLVLLIRHANEGRVNQGSDTCSTILV